VKFFTLDRSIGLLGGQIIHRHHRKRAHAVDELLSIEENDDAEKGDAAVQVRDYALALDDFLPRARAERHALFTPEFVQDLNRAVMKGDRDYKDALGELRKIVVWIGGAGHIANSTYNPTPPEGIAACLAERR
jgi:hypothetical protein